MLSNGYKPHGDAEITKRQVASPVGIREIPHLSTHSGLRHRPHNSAHTTARTCFSTGNGSPDCWRNATPIAPVTAGAPPIEFPRLAAWNSWKYTAFSCAVGSHTLYQGCGCRTAAILPNHRGASPTHCSRHLLRWHTPRRTGPHECELRAAGDAEREPSTAIGKVEPAEVVGELDWEMVLFSDLIRGSRSHPVRTGLRNSTSCLRSSGGPGWLDQSVSTYGYFLGAPRPNRNDNRRGW